MSSVVRPASDHPDGIPVLKKLGVDAGPCSLSRDLIDGFLKELFVASTYSIPQGRRD